MSNEQKFQIVYLSHGEGPIPILGDPNHKSMIRIVNNFSIQ